MTMMRSQEEAEIKYILFEAGWSIENIDRSWLIISEMAKRSMAAPEEFATSIAMVIAALGIKMDQ